MEEISRAAWSVYVALHNLAASHILGAVSTEVSSDGPILGDVDDVLEQLGRHEAVLTCLDPGLAQSVRETVVHWDSRPDSRLVELLPLLDQLEDIAGASLPPLLPPAI
ncbi:hypothetical protein [Streptomyces hokutonensis]|uniref:hypothetical protein n=1 Tax=Streptomyces hokutonensis TaxID=1306990 RepID=UPI003827F33A